MGAHGKYLEQYLESELWDKFRRTYVDADYENIWNGLFLMLEIFNEVALKISLHYKYQYVVAESQKIVKYLKSLM
jgi:aminoglycoside 6-adenylyltransferase